MAHHGNDSEFMKNVKPLADQLSMGKDELADKHKEMRDSLGATGEFPDGKLNKNDEGEIRFAVVLDDNKVCLDFGKPTAWVGMLPEQAKELGRMLISYAEDAEGNSKGKDRNRKCPCGSGLKYKNCCMGK